MVITKKSEEQIKDTIFNLFFQCKGETSSDRRPVLASQLSENIFMWCRDFIFKNDVENMGVEIFKVSERITKEGSKANIPTEKDGFFNYLYTALKSGKAGYYRKYEPGSIKISQGKKEKLRKVKDTIRMKESFLGRKLDENEYTQCISKWFKTHEYTELVNAVYVGNLSDFDNDESFNNDPLKEYLLKYDTEIIQKAIKSVLDKKQERSRDCFRALFTLFCFENDLKMLFPVLDSEILKACQEDQKKPEQYEIYQKYHPEAKKNSAGASASTMLDDFRNRLKMHLKDLPEISP